MDNGKAPPQRRQCGVEGCEQAEYRRSGACKNHQDYDVTYLCEVPGCTEKLRAKGKCFKHYQANRRRERGDVETTHERPARRTNPLSTRISDGCLEALEKSGKTKGVKAAEVLEDWWQRQAG